MNSERLDNLFGEIRNEAAETSVKEVGKWIAISAASAGLFGLLSQFKLPILLTKKLIIMTSIIASIGIGTTAILLSSSAKLEETPIAKKELAQASIQFENKTPEPENTFIASAPPTLESSDADEEESIDKIEIIPSKKIECENFEPKIFVLPTRKSEPNAKSCEGVERSVGYFNKLKVGGAFHVFISQGESESVTIKTNGDDDASRVITNVNNKVLEISSKKGRYKNKGGLTIHITMTDIKEFSISGASQVQSEDLLNAPELTLNLSGASQAILNIRSDNLKLKSSGAAGVELSGSSTTVNIAASGATNISAFDLKTMHTEIEASGASNIEISASENLIVSAKDASNIEYTGTPANLDVKNSLAANVSQRR